MAVSFDFLSDPREVNQEDMKAVVTAVLNEGEDDNDPINLKIRNDPQLSKLDRDAHKEMLRLRSEWQQTLALSSSCRAAYKPASSSRIFVEANTSNPFARAFRYIVSNSFQAAFRDGRFGDIASQLVAEICIASTIDECNIKSKMIAAFEEFSPRLGGKGLKQAVPAILLFLSMFFTSPVGRTWSDLGAQVIVASLKTALIYHCNIWLGVLALDFLDDFLIFRKDLINNGNNEASASISALNFAIASSPFATMSRNIYNWLVGEAKELTNEPLFADQDEVLFTHESFLDLCGHLNKIRDPVLVHGFQMERRFATEMVERGRTHPFTRNPMLRSHILEPTAEYTRLRRLYFRRRKLIIESAEQGEKSK